GARYVNAFASDPLWPSVFVTVTLAAPAACAGEVAVIVVALTTVTAVAAVPPTVTVAPARKPVPVIVRLVPPLVDPDVGATPVTVGAGKDEVYVKLLVSVADCVSAFVTVTLTVPAECAGVVALIVVLLTTVTPVAGVPPTATAAPAAKLVPVNVSTVPPVVEPLGRPTLASCGAGPRKVKPAPIEPLWPSVFVTTTVTLPAACAGVVAVMVVLLPTATPVAAVPPSATVAPVA